MSTHPQTATRRRASAPARRTAARRRAVLRRRLVAAAGAALLVAIAIVLAWPQFHHAVREITLPLRHEDIIRQQAHDKGLDPSLIAAVIYAESRFRDGQTSAAGAQGLMQLTPATARYIAHKSGGRPRHAPGQHRLRRLLPALPAAPLRGQSRLRARGLQRRRGQRRPLDRRGPGARPRAHDRRDSVRRDACVRQARAHGPRAVPQVVRRAARQLEVAAASTRVEA